MGSCRTIISAISELLNAAMKFPPVADRIAVSMSVAALLPSNHCCTLPTKLESISESRLSRFMPYLRREKKEKKKTKGVNRAYHQIASTWTDRIQ